MTAPTLALSLIFMLCEPRPLTLKFSDISITKAISTAKLAGIKAELPFKLEGRVGSLRVEIRDHIIIARVERVTVDNDSTKEALVRAMTLHYNRKTGYMSIHSLMLGGLVEITGIWK